jgi:hypothetical protein
VVESLGLPISKSEVSRICAGLDEHHDAFRDRPLEGRYPYLWLDAKVEKVRDGGRVVREALVLAYGVHQSGYRELIARTARIYLDDPSTAERHFGASSPPRLYHRAQRRPASRDLLHVRP